MDGGDKWTDYVCIFIFKVFGKSGKKGNKVMITHNYHAPITNNFNGPVVFQRGSPTTIAPALNAHFNPYPLATGLNAPAPFYPSELESELDTESSNGTNG